MTLTAAADLAVALRNERAVLGGGDATRFPQPRMAELLGVSLRQYQRWERGVSVPRPRDIERIVATLSRVDPKGAFEQRLLLELATIKQELVELHAELDALRARFA